MTEDENRSENLVYALAASPDFDRDGIVFAARASGLVMSEDGGKSWHDVYEMLKSRVNIATTAVSLSPDFGTDRIIFAAIPGSILRSADGGLSWQDSKITSPPVTVSAFVFSPNFTRDGTLVAGTMEDGVLITTDGGVTWNPWNFGLLDSHVIALAISPNFAFDGTLFAGTDTGVYKSKNFGRSWRETSFPPEWGPILCLGISPNFAHDANLFVGTESFGLQQTRDGGQTWRRVGEDMIPDVVNSILISPDYPSEPELIVHITDRLLVSSDGGVSWIETNQKGLEEEAISCVIAPLGFKPPSRLLVGTTGGRITWL